MALFHVHNTTDIYFYIAIYELLILKMKLIVPLSFETIIENLDSHYSPTEKHTASNTDTMTSYTFV